MARLLCIFLFFAYLFLFARSAGSRSISADEICGPSGNFPGSGDDDCDDCCKAGESYLTYECSPPVSGSTAALLTLNSFEEGGDGDSYQLNSESVVALSTGWYSGGSRCGRTVKITGNGRTTTAQVVDECDSTTGCDEEHGNQPPCRFNVVDGSNAVWEALGVTADSPEYGEMEMEITWTES